MKECGAGGFSPSSVTLRVPPSPVRGKAYRCGGERMSLHVTYKVDCGARPPGRAITLKAAVTSRVYSPRQKSKKTDCNFFVIEAGHLECYNKRGLPCKNEGRWFLKRVWKLIEEMWNMEGTRVQKPEGGGVGKLALGITAGLAGVLAAGYLGLCA